MRFAVVAILSGLAGVAFAYDTATGFQLPLDGSWDPSQDFGVWNGQWEGYHLGEDILRGDEAAVYATGNGRVKHARPRTGFGNVVVIEHRLPDGTYVCSVCGHMRADGLIGEEVDVERGQLIGYLSDDPAENGGYAFAHLHFGIREGVYLDWQYPGYGSQEEVAYWFDPYDFVVEHQAAYLCRWASQDPSSWIWVKPGDTRTFWVKYTNTGTATWINSGGVGYPEYVELWSCDQNGNIVNSWLEPVDWIDRQRVTTCNEASVPIGSEATFAFQAEIPGSSSGDRRVYFRPTHGGETMEDWGEMHFPIHVDADAPSVPASVTASPSLSSVNSFAFSWNASSDGGSGVAGYRWNVNGGAESFTTTMSVAASSYAEHAGANTFFVRAEDDVGNLSGYGSVDFTYSPGACAPPLPPCEPLAARQTGTRPTLSTLPEAFGVPDMTPEEWATAGVDGSEILLSETLYRIGFVFRTESAEPLQWKLVDPGSGKTLVTWASGRDDCPAADGKWHICWSRPFYVAERDLVPGVRLMLDAGSSPALPEVVDVQVLRVR